MSGMVVLHTRAGRRLGFTLYYVGLDGSIEKDAVRIF